MSSPDSGATPENQEGAAAPRLMEITVDPDVQSLDIALGMVDMHGATGLVKSVRVDQAEGLSIRLPQRTNYALGTPSGGAVDPEIVSAVQETSKALILQTKSNATRTQSRMGSTFGSYVVMIWVLFSVGIVGFVATLARGLTADTTSQTVTTVVYGGLSATAFVSVFLSRPVQAMSGAGPQAAWLQSIVNTYWTKLGYLNNPLTIIDDLDEAQSKFNTSMTAYLKATTPTPKKAATPEANMEASVLPTSTPPSTGGGG